MSWRRNLPGFLCGLALAAGCAHPAPPAPGTARVTTPVITPDLRPMGRVQRVNKPGHFVVVSFANGFMPDLEDRLGVFRNGSKIGEIKITGPQREFNIVAEILSGDPQVQDEVKAAP
jgi:hypothetical protein